MASDDDTAKTLSTIIDELDQCITEHYGLPGTFEVETDSAQSSILSLRAQLVQQHSIHGDIPLDQATIAYHQTIVPLPNCLPRGLTRAISFPWERPLTELITNAIESPDHRNTPTLTGAMQTIISRAASVRGKSNVQCHHLRTLPPDPRILRKLSGAKVQPTLELRIHQHHP